MLSKSFKKYIQKIAHSFGYHILSKNSISGDMEWFLKGIKSRGFVPKNILDVGANKGEWSASTSEIFTEASYYLIEPQEELASDIETFFKKNKGAWFLGGAGAEDGELALTVWDDFAGSSFLPTGNEIGGKAQRKVPIYAIDSLINSGKMPVPDLVKIDVQGFEIEVLKGASSIFGKTDVFILEASLFKYSSNQPLLHEIIAFMIEKGYFIYDFAGFANRPFDKALGQLDICFVKKESKLRQSNVW